MRKRYPVLRESHRAVRCRRPGQINGRGREILGEHFGREGLRKAEVSVGVVELMTEAALAFADNVIVGQC